MKCSVLEIIFVSSVSEACGRDAGTSHSLTTLRTVVLCKAPCCHLDCRAERAELFVSSLDGEIRRTDMSRCRVRVTTFTAGEAAAEFTACFGDPETQREASVIKLNMLLEPDSAGVATQTQKNSRASSSSVRCSKH